MSTGSRLYFRVTEAGFNALPVPEAFRANRGRMYDDQEPPQEIVPTFAQYLDFLGHPGGHLRRATANGTDYVLFGIPNLTGAEVEAIRELAIANGKTLPDVLLNTPEALAFLEAYATDNEGVL